MTLVPVRSKLAALVLSAHDILHLGVLNVDQLSAGIWREDKREPIISGVYIGYIHIYDIHNMHIYIYICITFCEYIIPGTDPGFDCRPLRFQPRPRAHPHSAPGPLQRLTNLLNDGAVCRFGLCIVWPWVKIPSSEHPIQSPLK